LQLQLFLYILNAVLLSALDMSIIQRIVSECSSFARQLHFGILLEQSSSAFHRGWCNASCISMASSCIETDTAEHEDNVRKTLEDGCDQQSAKRMKISDSSLENAVGVICSKL